MKKAMIAMSGGVDSSVAAWLMKRDGYDCMGVTMRLFAGEDSCERKGHTCCSLDDVEDARSVARQLGIPYFVFNFRHTDHGPLCLRLRKRIHPESVYRL